MRAENDLTNHRWWHHFLSRKLGLWRGQSYNEKTNEVCFITRTVRYCPICREDYHEGASVRAELAMAVGLPPTLAPVSNPAPDNVRQLPQPDKT
jgi:hypothetical protein